jgi:hypothetical protein
MFNRRNSRDAHGSLYPTAQMVHGWSYLVIGAWGCARVPCVIGAPILCSCLAFLPH